MVASGVDPSYQRKVNKLQKTEDRENTFKVVAEEWLNSHKNNWTKDCQKSVNHKLQNCLYPYIGGEPIRQISSHDLSEALRRTESDIRSFSKIILVCLGILRQYRVQCGMFPRRPYSAKRRARGKVLYMPRRYRRPRTSRLWRMPVRAFKNLLRRTVFLSFCLLLFAIAGIVNEKFPDFDREARNAVADNASKTDVHVPYYGKIGGNTPKAGARASSSKEVKVTRIIDGDTFKAEIEIHPGVFEEQSVRLRGIDAPEKKDRDNCLYARNLYEQSERRLKQLAGDRVILDNTKRGYYGRIIADVYTMEGRNIGEILLNEELVRVYKRPKNRPAWC